MRILALNCGSATIKYSLFRHEKGMLDCEKSGQVDQPADYGEAIAGILSHLDLQPDAVVHRIVHGGERFKESSVLHEQDLEPLKQLSSLAPLHNPPALEGLQAALALGVPQVVVFDTAFHQSMPAEAYTYALPREVGSKFGIRRYGFHGISHAFVTEQYAAATGTKAPTIITLHLGNGSSVTAVKEGRSVDTSMGYGPLEGLVMGTRPGDLDSTVLLKLFREGYDERELDRMLNRESGLKGMADTHDMRALLKRSDPDARLAVEVFCYRVRKYIGAYLAVLGGAEAIVFTGGIGENAPLVRARIAGGFEWAGLTLDKAKNEAQEKQISTLDSSLHAYIIPTNEERMMAREAVRLLKG